MYHSFSQDTPSPPSLERLLAIFAQVFRENYRTELLGGAPEPFYQPAKERDGWARIYFTRDYFASALHEVAHWCVAGEARRKLADYGYWYAPDGRSAEQQKVFEQVEVVPQALEWIFSVACGVAFRVSADNLDSQLGASMEFRQAVWNQVQKFCVSGVPERALAFALALASEFGQGDPFVGHRYQLPDI